MKDYSELFNRFVTNNTYFLQAVEIAQVNSQGDLWIIGGFVFRNLAAALYGGVRYHSDIDLVSSGEKNKEMRVPVGWNMRANSYGTPKFEQGDYSVDLCSLIGWHSIERRGLEPTIHNALSGTPLTIQSIAYDIQRREIIGDVGIRAIVDRTVGVNNLTQAEYYSLRKHKPINQIIEEKALDLGFSPVSTPSS